MEDNTTQDTSPVQPASTETPPETVHTVTNTSDTQPPIPKSSNFLVTLLSLLLLLAVFAAGFFAWQTQNIAKQIKSTSSPGPVDTSTPFPTPIGYYGYQKTRTYNLSLPEECVTGVMIECTKANFKLSIDPEAGGRGTDTPTTSEKINIGGIDWERITWDVDNTKYSTYGLTQDNDYFLIEVRYNPFSTEAQTYFEEILSTFEFSE